MKLNSFYFNVKTFNCYKTSFKSKSSLEIVQSGKKWEKRVSPMIDGHLHQQTTVGRATGTHH